MSEWRKANLGEMDWTGERFGWANWSRSGQGPVKRGLVQLLHAARPMDINWQIDQTRPGSRKAGVNWHWAVGESNLVTCTAPVTNIVGLDKSDRASYCTYGVHLLESRDTLKGLSHHCAALHSTCHHLFSNDLRPVLYPSRSTNHTLFSITTIFRTVPRRANKDKYVQVFVLPATAPSLFPWSGSWTEA